MCTWLDLHQLLTADAVVWPMRTATATVRGNAMRKQQSRTRKKQLDMSKGLTPPVRFYLRTPCGVGRNAVLPKYEQDDSNLSSFSFGPVPPKRAMTSDIEIFIFEENSG